MGRGGCFCFRGLEFTFPSGSEVFVHICYQGIQDVLRIPSAPRGNTVEMSSLIYANKHCEMTSFTPPIAVLPGDPVALKELLGSLEGNFLEPCLGYLRTWQSLLCVSACPPGGQAPARESGRGGGGGENYKQNPRCFFPSTWDQSVINTATLEPTNLPPPGNACLNQWP